MSVNEIIQKIKDRHAEIILLENERSFRQSNNQLLVQYDPEKLNKNFSTNKKCYLINSFTNTAVKWNKVLENYIVITKINKKPTTGHIQVSKEGKLQEIEKNLKNEKEFFTIKQDFFDSHFFRVLKDGKEYLKEVNKFFNGFGQESVSEPTNDGNEESERVAMKLNSVNTILYGPPGTGKTYNSVKYAVNTIDSSFKGDSYEAYLSKFNELKEAGQIAFTTFHQSYGYEEFIEGIKPKLTSQNDEIQGTELTSQDNGKQGTELSFRVVDGLFKDFCDRAQKDMGNKYVFIIDEINRGNISKIFGELITLIEDSKRDGAKEAMSVQLPYSGKRFTVPNNVYILGTMNTADRSIALMDTALRRRFEFVEMMPDTEESSSPLKEIPKIAGIDIRQMLEMMNKRIELLYDREHTLGHAFFMNLKEEPSMDQLSSIFKNKIIPLLQEYFYEDYEKIMLVLGINPKNAMATNFISKKDEKDLFQFTSDNIELLPTYQINYDAFDASNSYQKIYQSKPENGGSNETKDEESPNS